MAVGALFGLLLPSALPATLSAVLWLATGSWFGAIEALLLTAIRGAVRGTRLRWPLLLAVVALPLWYWFGRELFSGEGWKLLFAPAMGQLELYRLDDERVAAELSAAEPAVARDMLGLLLASPLGNLPPLRRRQP